MERKFKKGAIISNFLVKTTYSGEFYSNQVTV